MNFINFTLLFDCLMNKRLITLSQKSTPNERKVYRLLKENRYSIKDVLESITKKKIKTIASNKHFILSIIQVKDLFGQRVADDL